MFVYSRYEDKPDLSNLWNYDVFNKLFPAILLIISVVLFRCRFKGKKSEKILAREKIIVVHLVIFASYVLTYAAGHG